MSETRGLQVSVVIPCLNEAASIEQCVRSALAVLHASGLNGEVVVADNDSEDGSPQLAAAAGAVVFTSPSAATGAPTWPDSRPPRAATS